LRARCEVIKALVARNNAEVTKALQHYQVAVQYAKLAKDDVQLVWASVQKFRLVAEFRPSDELAPILTEIRQAAVRAGDPHAVAYMHYAVALMEASNGRTREARRHLGLTDSLLQTYPNAWLEQLNLIAAFFLDFLECDYQAGLEHLKRARAFLPITGSLERTLIDCNEAHVLLVIGRLTSAAEKFRRVIDADKGMVGLSAMEGLARVYLSDDDKLTECERILDTHDALLSRDEHLAAAFVGRWTAATRVRLLLKKRLFAQASETAANVIKQTAILNDRLLAAELTCLRAEALAALGDTQEGARSLSLLSIRAAGESIGQLASYFAARGLVTRTLDSDHSRQMLLRARRVWEADGNQRALDESKHWEIDDPGDAIVRHGDSAALLTASTLSAALMVAHNPRLLGQELTAAIRILDCSPHVQLVKGRPISKLGRSDDNCVLPLGSDGTATWALVCEIPDDPLKSLALSDVARICAGALAVRERIEEAKKRAALWPETRVEEEAGGLFPSEEMKELLATARRVAATNVSVLITGETGTGKEVLAKTIHGYSHRAKGLFVPFNCTSTPKDMLDSQLFGHRRGSFTGATEHFSGVIRGASGGTLFLDEIGDMPLDVQPKLLRFLESNEVHPVGEAHPVRVDVRLLAATNANLDALVADGRFREDLFYRLNIVRLHLPPLRERRIEIPALAQHYLEKHTREYGKRDIRLSEETMEYLLLYRWPGNIRQLANEMRRLTALAESGAVLTPGHLSPDIAASRRTIPASERPIDPSELVVRMDQPMAAATEHLERSMLHYALNRCGGRIEETAALLGLSRKGLYLKRQRYGIDPPEPSHHADTN
jgi:DNA-binding NtrC family response regulator